MMVCYIAPPMKDVSPSERWLREHKATAQR